MNNPIKKLNKFYQISLGVFLLLAFIRWVFHPTLAPTPSAEVTSVGTIQHERSVPGQRGASVTYDGYDANGLVATYWRLRSRDFTPVTHAYYEAKRRLSASSGIVNQQGPVSSHPIHGVYNYSKVFPDLQDVQIVAARKNGVRPPRNRAEAECRKEDLVYVGCSPYFHLDAGMQSSIPYLVPKASVLLNRIGRNFFDSLYVKGIPLHKIIVSSVLRSQEDVNKLTRTNVNASKESCHRYGTTFDICYTRFHTVSPPDGPARRVVRDDTLMWVLSEVLRDLREQDLCYVKHEAKQSCFHITVR